MYYSIKSGGWQRIAEPTGQEEGLLGIFPYEKSDGEDIDDQIKKSSTNK